MPWNAVRIPEMPPIPGEARRPRDDQSPVHLYLIILTPNFNQYFRWAFGLYRQGTKDWLVFEALMHPVDGHYEAWMRRSNPSCEVGCEEIILLGFIHKGWWETLVWEIGRLPVPGPQPWNCQDYVMAMWNIVKHYQMVDNNTWDGSWRQMIRYFGRVFSWVEDDAWSEEERQQGRQVLDQLGVYHWGT